MTPCTSTSTETVMGSSPKMLIGKEKSSGFYTIVSFTLRRIPMYAQFADA